jgi:hypothetical protein
LALEIYAMLVQQVNPVSPQPLQRTLHSLADVLSFTVPPVNGPFTILDIKPNFGADCNLVSHWCKRLAHELFIFERTLYFGCIE